MEITKDTVQAWVKAKTKEVAKYAEKTFGLKYFTSSMKIRTSVSPKRYRSWGGRSNWNPYVSFALAYKINATKFEEYPVFAKNSIIGSLNDVETKRVLMALITHEVAHAVQFYISKNEKQIVAGEFRKIGYTDSVLVKNNRFMGHNEIWQMIYAILRTKFVNNGVEITDPEIIIKKKRSYNTKIKCIKKKDTFGNNLTIYLYNDKAIAVGLADIGCYNIYKIVDEKTVYLKAIKDGRGARKWILENLHEFDV